MTLSYPNPTGKFGLRHIKPAELSNSSTDRGKVDSGLASLISSIAHISSMSIQ